MERRASDRERATSELASKLLIPLTAKENARVCDEIEKIGPYYWPDSVVAGSGSNTVQRGSFYTLIAGMLAEEAKSKLIEEERAVASGAVKRAIDAAQWLNDEIINMYLCILNKWDKTLCKQQPERKQSHCFNSFFVQAMFDEKNTDRDLRGKYNYGNVKTWSKKVPGRNIFNMKYIICPINIYGNHWVLAVIDIEGKCIQWNDSLGGTDWAKLNGLLAYVNDEHKEMNGGQGMVELSEWKLIRCTADTPRQRNNYDCGMYLCISCLFILNGYPLLYKQDHIDKCRTKIAFAILEGALPCSLLPPSMDGIEHLASAKDDMEGIQQQMSSANNDTNDTRNNSDDELRDHWKGNEYEFTIGDNMASPRNRTVKADSLSSPSAHLDPKRKAALEDTPSGVHRHKQSLNFSQDIHAGNTTTNTVTTSSISSSSRCNGNDSLADPPALDRNTHLPISYMSMTGSNREGDIPNSSILENIRLGIDHIGHGCVDDIQSGVELDGYDYIAGLFESSCDSHDDGDGDNLFNTLSSAVAMNCDDESIDCYDYIPSEMKVKSFKQGYKLSKQYSKPCMAGERVGWSLPLNTMEDQLLFGCGGIMRTGLGMWNVGHSYYLNGKTEQSNLQECHANTSKWELLEELYCPAYCGGSGCQRRLLVYRVIDGIVIFEKVDDDDEIIHHDIISHNKRPDNKNSSAYVMTVAQKMKSLDLIGKEPPSIIAQAIVNDPNIQCTPEQSSNLKTVARQITKWKCKQETQNKYLRHSWEHTTMTKKVQVEIFDSLMAGGVALCQNKNYFAGSPLYKDMADTIVILSHDFHEGGACDYVLFTLQDVQLRIHLAAQIYKQESEDGKGAVQFHCDFTHLHGSKYQLGMVSVEDCNHKGWPTTFIISPPESIKWATRVMKHTVDLIEADPDAKIDKALIDGANSLWTAAETLGVTCRSCHAHVGRVPIPGDKKSGKKGTKGSLCRYCTSASPNSTEKPLSMKNAVKVSMLL